MADINTSTQITNEEANETGIFKIHFGRIQFKGGQLEDVDAVLHVTENGTSSNDLTSGIVKDFLDKFQTQIGNWIDSQTDIEKARAEEIRANTARLNKAGISFWPDGKSSTMMPRRSKKN